MADITAAQLVTLKNDIIAAGAEFSSVPHNADGGDTIAKAYNLAASPAFVVWRTNVTRDECQALAGFDWTLVDNLTVGKGRIWEWMFMRGAAIDASQANIRAGISACWVGSAPLVAVATAILTLCKRNATRAEKLLSSGTGSTAVPATMTFEGVIQAQDVVGAMGW